MEQKPRDNPMERLPDWRTTLPLAQSCPRCGAKNRAGKPCRSPAMRGKARCRMHGGASTGARTAEGMARIKAAATKHGCYGAEARTMRGLVRELRHLMRETVAEV